MLCFLSLVWGIAGFGPSKDPDTAAKYKIRTLLLRSLRPSDLSLPKEKLEQKVIEIGERSSAFTVPELDGFLTAVKKSSGQWVIVVHSASDEVQEADKGFLICLIAGQISISALPDSPSQLEGPIQGEWRRSGIYTVGVGVNLVTHQPSWYGGKMLVYRSESSGMVLSSFVDFEGDQLRFASRRSLNVVGQDSNALCKVIDTHKTGFTEEVKWNFLKGKFREISRRPLFPEVLAFDRLLSAAEHHQTKTFKAMVPQVANRKWLLRDLRRCLDKDIEYIDFVDGSHQLGLVKLGEPQLQSHCVLSFKRRNSGWVVSKIEKR